jgi:hypothetical protein
MRRTLPAPFAEIPNDSDVSLSDAVNGREMGKNKEGDGAGIEDFDAGAHMLGDRLKECGAMAAQIS